MIALAVLGAISCVALGMSAANRLNRRDEALQTWEGTFLRMDAAVNHSAAALEEVLQKGAAEDLPVLKELIRRLETTPAASISDLLKDLPWDDTLLPTERDTIKDCLTSLFSPSLQTQSQALAYAQAQWWLYRQACREARDKNARLYTSLGWLGGAAMFILLC